MKALKPGTPAPGFTLPDQTGEPRTLSTLLDDGPVVLFFYPIAASGGCTQEACHFRDLRSQFEQYGAQRVGISTDDVSKQAGFASAQDLDYPLLSDEDGAVATAYGVKRRFLTPVKRVTFVIGRDGVIADVVASEFGFDKHADGALEALARL